jgi:hypothetical protein
MTTWTPGWPSNRSCWRGCGTTACDEHGEFFHLCTEVLGSRLFFEVVQRIGGYTGRGEANAPVRMAAHRQLRMAAAAPRSPTGRGAPADSSPIMLAGA